MCVCELRGARERALVLTLKGSGPTEHLSWVIPADDDVLQALAGAVTSGSRPALEPELGAG